MAVQRVKKYREQEMVSKAALSRESVKMTLISVQDYITCGSCKSKQTLSYERQTQLTPQLQKVAQIRVYKYFLYVNLISEGFVFRKQYLLVHVDDSIDLIVVSIMSVLINSG